MDRNWNMSEHLAGAHVTCPSLCITGSLDPVAGFAPVEPGLAFSDDHRGNRVIEGAGRWVQQERADELHAILIEFLGDVTPAWRA
jgi:pimeloyl-ACP methyl ester carboxylesterase